MASRLARCDELSPPYGLTTFPDARAVPGASSAARTTKTTAHQYLRALRICCLLVSPPGCAYSGRLRSAAAAAPEFEPDGQLHRSSRQCLRGLAPADTVGEHAHRGIAE